MDEILRLLLGPFGTLVLALTILLTGWKRMWVFGWHYREVAAEKDEWKAMAMRGTEMALQGTKIAEQVVTLHENGPR